MKKESNRGHGQKKNGEHIDVENLWGEKENGDDGIYYTGKDHHGKHYRGT